jgi:HlyD family secretion protein
MGMMLTRFKQVFYTYVSPGQLITMAKRLILLLALVAAGAAAYWYWTRSPAALVLTGIVTTNDVIVSPQIGGRIEELTVREGDLVTPAQVLALISPGELRAERAYALHSAEGVTSQIAQAAAAADLEAARLSFERTQNLSRDGVASAQELDQARTAHQAAVARADALTRQADAQRAAVSLIRTNTEQVLVRRSQVQTNQHLQEAAAAQRARADVRLGYAEVRAPMAGIVDVSAARVGEVVNPGQPIVTLINPDDLWVRADVEETYIDRVRIGDRMHVRLPSGSGMECPVFYRGVDAGFATQRDVSRTKRDIKTFEIRLRCDNSGRRLAVGMTAYVSLPLQ